METKKKYQRRYREKNRLYFQNYSFKYYLKNRDKLGNQIKEYQKQNMKYNNKSLPALKAWLTRRENGWKGMYEDEEEIRKEIQRIKEIIKILENKTNIKVYNGLQIGIKSSNCAVKEKPLHTAIKHNSTLS